MPDYGDDRGFGIPQRVTRPTMRDVAGPVRETNEMPRFSDTPTSIVSPIAGMNLYPQQRGYGVDPGLRRGAYEQWRNPVTQAVPMSSNEFLTSRFSGGLGDQFATNDNARGMIEGAGINLAGGAFGSGSKSQRDNIRDINVYNMLVDRHGQVKADEIYGEYLRKKYELSGTGAPSGEYIPGGTKLVN